MAPSGVGATSGNGFSTVSLVLNTFAKKKAGRNDLPKICHRVFPGSEDKSPVHADEGEVD